MLYVDFNADKDYKLRLNTRGVIQLEKQLGCNPLAIFGNGDTIPTITTMVAILHASLQAFHHGISVDDAYNIFDAWLDKGHSTVDFVNVILEIYKTSGIVPNNTVEDVEKN